jgi:F0F1-type ATP synthase membrane subunit a
MLLFSPMEQYEIYSIGTFSIIINQINIYMLIVTLSLILLAFTTTSSKLISNWWVILNESLYKTILSMVTSYINIKSIIFYPMIFTIFNFILLSNLIGMIPYSSTPTVEIIMTLTLAFTILIGVLIMGFFSHK